MSPDFLELRLDLWARRVPHVLATVVEVSGSSSAPVDSKALIGQDGTLLSGFVGGGCAEAMVKRTALESLETGLPIMIDIDLNDEIFGAGMPCGGSMRVYVAPRVPAPRLWLLGHGRIVESLCEQAAMLGFEIQVMDPLARPERFPAARRVVAGDGQYREVMPDAADFVVIATHHKGDYAAIRHLLSTPCDYLALVASHQRASLVLRRLREEGIAAADLARLRAPAGLALGARTPEEIALAIVAEMVMVRRGGQGLCKRDLPPRAGET